MAEIKANTSEKIFPLKEFLGLNQNPDGDTKLKMGEAAAMDNFRITRDKNLQRRPGTKTLVDLGVNKPIKGLWVGYVSGTEYMLGACNGKLYKFWDSVSSQFSATEIGSVSTENDVHIFGFSNIAYILDGSKYRQWDGNELKEVEGYSPLVVINIPPDNGSGESSSLENVNRLSPKRRVWLSPDGTGTTFHLPEFDLESIDYVLDFKTGGKLTRGDYSAQIPGDYYANEEIGTITFADVPAQSVNRYEVGYTTRTIYTDNTSDGSITFDATNGITHFQLPERYLAMILSVTVTNSQAGEYTTVFGYSTYVEPSRPARYIPHESVEIFNATFTFDLAAGAVNLSGDLPDGYDSITISYKRGGIGRGQVERMQYSELFSGTQDTRIFLYGDGTNKTIYSGIDYNGAPRADYFPDLYEALVGDSNTPITGMIRHYSSLACFKKDSAWSITASSTTLAEGLNIPAFYITPVNKTVGLSAPGQVRLVMNSPFTVFSNDCYEWKNSSYYTSNLTRDERQAKRISDRVWSTLKSYATEKCYCYDDNDNQEYYICFGEGALVYNYAADAWYRYTDFPVSCMANLNGELYIGASDGKLKHFSILYLNDDGAAIEAHWESGSMSFSQDYMRKYSSMLWVTLKPQTKSEVNVTVETDKRFATHEKVVLSAALSTFGDANFAKWSFRTNTNPSVKRIKIKAKKFVYYKIIFKSYSADTRATIISADVRVRYTGVAK